jgi:hypothetical protein
MTYIIVPFGVPQGTIPELLFERKELNPKIQVLIISQLDLQFSDFRNVCPFMHTFVQGIKEIESGLGILLLFGH